MPLYRQRDLDRGSAIVRPAMRDRQNRHDSGAVGFALVRAAEAVALFCYQVRKWIGAFAAALGGLDTLVFAGGIGENAPPARERICDGLVFWVSNSTGSAMRRMRRWVSSDTVRVKVRVIRTDEELMIARSVAHLLVHSSRPERWRDE